MKVLFVNSGLKGVPEGYAAHIVNSLIIDFRVEVKEIWPSNLTAGFIDTFSPDVLFVFHGNLTDLDLVRYARQKGIITLVWIVEDPYEIDVHTKEWLESYDLLFTNELAALSYYQADNVHYLPWCSNSRIYKPLAVPDRYKSDLCFVGMGFTNRVEIINELESVIKYLKVFLIGSWDRWGGNLKPSLRRFIRPVVNDPLEVARYYNGALINLNIHRSPYDRINVNTPGVGAESLNNRVFDIAATGGFQLVDNSRSELKKFYYPGQEIAVFDSPRDLAIKIRQYLQYPELARIMGKNAYLKTMKFHCFRHRMKKLIYQVLEGRAVKGPGPEIYQIKQGRKHHLLTLQAFYQRGFQEGSEINVSTRLLNIFPEGKGLL